MQLARRHRAIFLYWFLLSISGGWVKSRAWAQTPEHSEKKADLAYQKGMDLLRRQQYGEALRQFKLVEKESPKLPQGYTGEGIALALSGKPHDAIAVLSKALAIDPSYWLARRELGILQWGQGQKTEAVKNLNAIVKLFPNDAEVNAILGENASAEKDFESAAKYFSLAPSQVASSPHLSLLAAQALIKNGRRQDAALQLVRLSQLPNLNPQQAFEIGWLLGEAGEYAKAIAMLKSPPPDAPDPFAWGYALALAYYESGDYAHCIQTLKQLKDRGVVRADLYALQGTAEEKAGHTMAAYNAFREGIYQIPQDDQCYLNLATLSVQHLNYDVAAQVLTAGIKRLPDDYKLCLTRGVVFTLSKKMAAAQADYEKAVALAPRESSVYLALGMCYEDQGKLEDAVRTLKEGIATQSRDALLYYFLADVLFRQGIAPRSAVYGNALEAVQEGLRIDPAFAYGYVQRAKLEMISKQLDAAIGDLERARALAPQSQTVLYQLALAYQRVGRRAEAANIFDKVAQSSRERDAKFRKGKLIEIMIATTSNGGRGGR